MHGSYCRSMSEFDREAVAGLGAASRRAARQEAHGGGAGVEGGGTGLYSKVQCSRGPCAHPGGGVCSSLDVLPAGLVALGLWVTPITKT